MLVDHGHQAFCRRSPAAEEEHRLSVPPSAPATSRSPAPSAPGAERDALVAEVEALVEAGRSLEAIDLLQAREIARHDAALCERLLVLRHHAFAELPGAPRPGPWPPEAPDRFAGVDGLPEIDGDDLDAGLVASGIRHHGSLIVRGLVGDADVETLVAGTDRAIAARDAWSDGADPAETAPWFAPFVPDEGYAPVENPRGWVKKGGGVWTADSPIMMFELLDVFGRAGITDVINGYLGERSALSVQKSTLRKVPHDLQGADWHQDGAFLDRGEGIRALNVWMALTPCGVDAPGLEIVPRRLDHLFETGTEGAWFDWSVGPGLVERATVDAPVVRPVFEAGDVVFFDDFNLHRTAVDPSMTVDRHAVESWFFATSKYPSHHCPILL
jgi:hypothetical protein